MKKYDYAEIVKLVQDRLWNNGDLDLVERHYDKDCILHATSGDLRGAAAIRNAVVEIRASFPDWHEKLEDIFASGNKVCFRHTSTGTHQGTFMGYAATGNRVEVREIGIVLFRKEKVVEHWAMFDLLGWLTQMGAKVNR